MKTKNDKELKLTVSVRNVTFGYNKSNLILDNINVNVVYGKIYALLGSSGCGKTTLLKCILGQLTPQSGQINVFGHKPGSKFNKIIIKKKLLIIQLIILKDLMLVICHNKSVFI